MTEVGPADRAKLLRSKRADQSSILTSRKRKLRELFAVATDEDGFPSFDFSDPDAPPITPLEQKFLNECDISLGRKIDERILPASRPISFDALKQRAATLAASSLKHLPAVAPHQVAENGSPQHVTTTTVGFQQPSAALSVANGVPQQAATSNAAASTPQRIEEPAIRKEHPAEQGDAGLDGVESPVRKTPLRQPPAETGEKPLLNGAGSVVETSTLENTAHPLVAPLGNLGSATPTGNEHEAQDLGLGQPNGIPGDLKAAEAIPDNRPSHADPSRYPDALSSPGSTAQSTLTTTIHEGSADTSPDHEEPQYSGKDEEGISERLEPDHGVEDDDRQGEAGPRPEAPVGPSSPLPAAVSGVEAQLLEESAAAQLSQIKAPVEAPKQILADSSSQLREETRDETTASKSGDVPGKQDVDVVGREPETPELALSADLPASGIETQGSADPMDVDEEQASTAPKDAPSRQTGSLDAVQPQATVSETTAVPVATDAPSVHGAHPTIIVTADFTPLAPQPQPQQVDTAEPNPSTATSPLKFSSSLPGPQSGEISASQTLSAPQLRLLTHKVQDRRRRSVPTVIFGKQAKQPRASDDSSLAVSRRQQQQQQQQQGHIPVDDYFTPLFIEGFTRQSTWMKPIEKLLNQAHKTLSTPDQYVSILDHQACKILRRVYHLQQHDKWSLRQPVRCPEPTRPPSHWDVLLQEMKWMRTDFREERKWKRAVARNLAFACAGWVHSSPVERLALQVNAVIPPVPAAETVHPPTADHAGGQDDALPELIHSDSPMEDSTIDHDEEPLDVSIETIAPATIFALQDDEVVFSLQPSKTADELLVNLPLYGSPLRVPKFDFVGSDYDPDARWRRPALPLSKYVEGEMVLDVQPPPRKRSRFQYRYDAEDHDGDEVIFGAKPDDGTQTQPEIIDVALFNPEMRSTRERLHASHQFRPPTEHLMPTQSFYECRTASQWTWAEDDQLKSLVREYSYNWSLISTIVSTPSLFASGAERRTPWECFERWVQLEGLPNDFGKSPYFKAYQGRIDAAQKTIQELNQKAQQQVGPNGAVTPIPRRRPTTTVRVERRRNQKHLAMIDAMRKLAKKREGNAQKASQAANLASMRKANESQAPVRQQVPNKTPREYSLMRWERDQQLAERMAQYARRTEMQKRVIQQGPHVGQVPATPGAVPVTQSTAAQMAAANALNAAARANIPGQLAVAGQARPVARVPMQTPGGAAVHQVQAAQLAGGLVPPHPMAAIPQAHLQAMQAQVQAQQRLTVATPQPDIGNLVLQARRIQDQQRAAVQQLQQQQQQQHQLQQQHQPQPQQVVQQLQQLQQHQQAIQQPQQMAQMNGAQGSPPMRNVVNGLNQGAFMSNAQAMMASFNAANGAGMATSPGAGLTMPSMVAGSPRGHSNPPQQLPVVTQRLRELEAHYRSKSPNLAPDAIRQLATEHLSKLIVQSQQHAMNAAVGGVVQQPMNGMGMTATSSPHQYAQLLRAQQAQQAAAQASQHQRQASGSGTTVPGK